MVEPLPFPPETAVKKQANGNENRYQQKWKIRVRDLQKQAVIEEIFDNVMVCNGHYFQPSIPKIMSDENFLGQKLHSHDYRVPDIFKDKSVVVIGAGPSGSIVLGEKFLLSLRIRFQLKKYIFA